MCQWGQKQNVAHGLYLHHERTRSQVPRAASIDPVGNRSNSTRLAGRGMLPRLNGGPTSPQHREQRKSQDTSFALSLLGEEHEAVHPVNLGHTVEGNRPACRVHGTGARTGPKRNKQLLGQMPSANMATHRTYKKLLVPCKVSTGTQQPLWVCATILEYWNMSSLHNGDTKTNGTAHGIDSERVQQSCVATQAGLECQTYGPSD